MLVLAFERISLHGLVPLQHFPVDESRRVDVDFFVVPRMRVPQLGRLPVDGPDERPDHRLGRVFDPREAKVGNLGDPLRRDEHVGRLDVAVDDGRFVQVQVLDPARDPEHDVEHRRERRRIRLADVVKQVPVRAQLGDDHDGDVGRRFRERDPDELDHVRVVEVAEQAELLDVHVGEVTADLADGDRTLAILALVDVLSN
jgi:hypothetical protein